VDKVVREGDGGRSIAAGRGPLVPARVPWGVLDGLAAVAFSLLVQGAFGLILAAGPDDLAAQLKAGAASYAAVLAAVWAMVRLRSGGGAAKLLGLKAAGLRAAISGCVAAAAGAAAYLAVHQAFGAVLYCLNMGWEDVPRQPLVRLIAQAGSARLVWLSVAVGVILAPVAEEVLFRSVLYLPLRARWGVLPAAVAVSVLFAAMHAYPWGTPMLFVLGLTFTALFESTGTLWAPILAHSLYNGIMVLLVRMA